MPINTLAYAKIFMTALDEQAVQEATTGWMDANAGQVIYNGGNEVKIPKMSVDGLADYDRDSGYVQGGVTLSYETRTMTQDRGRKFQLDAMDVDETNFVANASAVMGAFQREKVVPEIDAYRLSAIATAAITAGNVEYGYTPADTTILRKIKEAIKEVKANGYKDAVIHITSDALLELELACAAQLRSVTFRQGGIDTQVPAVDGVPLIETASDRMVTAITTLDGTTTGQEAGGWAKAASGKDINFIVVGRRTPIAITKQDKMKVFTPDQNQDADAWKMNYRRYHDLWILDNKVNSIFVNIKDAATSATPVEGGGS